MLIKTGSNKAPCLVKKKWECKKNAGKYCKFEVCEERFGYVCKNKRVVFNIAGNKYRLIVAIKYKYNRIFICFVGTHKQYDKVNAEEIWDI